MTDVPSSLRDVGLSHPLATPAAREPVEDLSVDDTPYSEDYFERGVEKGLSLYTDYRWMGRPTIDMCNRIAEYIDLAAGDAVLDFGCAKGFVVKALRVLGYQAWGTDISRYAIDCVDPDVAQYCWWTRRMDVDGLVPPSAAAAWSAYDSVIAKDVLEHIPAAQLPDLLRALAEVSRSLFVAVPLGDGERYFIEEYELDRTHVVRQPTDWWCSTLELSGWRVRDHRHRLNGVKDHWATYPLGNLFVSAESTIAR